MFLVDAQDEEAIRRRLRDDPWSPTERLVVASIEPSQILLRP
jgi:hypothetical protein